jgi:hypothetical protein
VRDGLLFRVFRLHGKLYRRMFGMLGMRKFMFK